MNYSEWLESLVESPFSVNDKPSCPNGYKWSKKQMMCVPKSAKDDVGAQGSKDRKPENGPGYNVIGSHGQNGAPYAYEEDGINGNGDGE